MFTPASHQSHNNSPYRILYIDDEQALLDLAKIFLERTQSFSVDTENDPEKGLQRLLNGDYDAVISDFQMPVMDGISLLKEVRRSGSNIPFIIFTGKGREDVVIEALNSGADFYLQKGGDPKSQFAELSRKLEHAIARQQTEDELRRKNEELTAIKEELQSRLEKLIATQNDLRQSRDLFRTFIDHSYDAVFIHDEEGNVLDVNETMLRLYQMSRDEALRFTIADYSGSCYNADESKDMWKSVLSGKEQFFTWQARRPKDGTLFDVEVFLTHVHMEGRQYILAFVRDIAERKHAEKERSLNEQRLSTLLELSQMTDSAEHTITEFALEQGVGITESTIGYLGFVDKDETVMMMHPWMFDTVEASGITDMPLIYPVDDTRLFSEVIRQRRAIIINELEADTPYTKWYPGGHVPVQRHMHIPVIDEGQTVIVAGVGNKEEPYTEQDERQLTLLMDGLWKILRRKRSEEEIRKKNEELVAAEEEMRSQLEEIVRMQDELREVNEYLEKLIVYANTPIIVWDTNQQIIRFNRSIEGLTGIAGEEAIGSDLRIIFPPDIWEEAMDYVKDAIAGASWEELEIPIQRQTGERRIVLWNSANIAGPDGKTIIATIAQGQDITDRKNAEDEIRLHLTRTRVLLDIYRHSDATDQEIMEYALEGSRKMALSRYSFVGLMTPDESVMRIHAWSRDVMADCQMAASPVEFSIAHAGIIGEAVRTRAPVIINDYTADHPEKHGCPEGHVPIHRFLAVPICDGSSIAAVLAVANKQDPYTAEDADALKTLGNMVFGILDRKRTEVALRESEQRFRRLAENAEDIIYRIDLTPDPVIVYVNPVVTEITGYTPDEHYSDVGIGERMIHPDDRELFTSIIRGDRWQEPVDLRLIRKDGDIVWVEQKTVPVYNENGRLVAIEAISRDITAAKKVEEERVRSAAAIADANRKLNLMTGITRHDIANQLMVLNGYLSLAMDLKPKGALTEYLGKMMGVAERIWRQIEFTREYQDLGVSAPVWQQFSHLLIQIPGETIRIVDRTADVLIYADPLLPKVFANLMENTERYATGATRVLVTCAEENGAIRIVWEDDGIGIPEEEKERIFERGFGKSTGLGLFFIREILEITGITITEEGKYGEGARLVIRVPESGWRFSV